MRLEAPVRIVRPLREIAGGDDREAVDVADDEGACRVGPAEPLLARDRQVVDAADVVEAAPSSTLVSFRVENDEGTALVERLREGGVDVREIPGRGLVRVSCGWWTSDDDLERLAAGVDNVPGT